MSIAAIGEVKSGEERVGLVELDRLDAAVSMLASQGSADGVKRLLVSRRGFTRELERRGRQRSEVELVDLTRLYGGS